MVLLVVCLGILLAGGLGTVRLGEVPDLQLAVTGGALRARPRDVVVSSTTSAMPPGVVFHCWVIAQQITHRSPRGHLRRLGLGGLWVKN